MIISGLFNIVIILKFNQNLFFFIFQLFEILKSRKTNYNNKNCNLTIYIRKNYFVCQKFDMFFFVVVFLKFHLFENLTKNKNYFLPHPHSQRKISCLISDEYSWNIYIF